jgi:hypothetical protein
MKKWLLDTANSDDETVYVDYAPFGTIAITPTDDGIQITTYSLDVQDGPIAIHTYEWDGERGCMYNSRNEEG